MSVICRTVTHIWGRRNAWACRGRLIVSCTCHRRWRDSRKWFLLCYQILSEDLCASVPYLTHIMGGVYHCFLSRSES